MKRLFTITLCMVAVCAGAQSLPAILASIEKNNTRLAALASENAAAVAQLGSETSIVGPTSVEYSPFFGNADGLASSELIVSQEFDFPTLGAMRKQSVNAQRHVLDLQYQTERRDIVLEAKKLCYDISAAVCTRNLLDQRLLTADSLLAATTTSMNRGNATIIDVNRIKMDRMEVNTQLVQARGEIATLASQLQGLNGGIPIENIDDLVLSREPACDKSAPTLEQEIAQAQLNAATHEIKVAEKGWLPSLTVGYRRNTDHNDATNGFLVGVSMPLFSNSGKVKAARARQQAAMKQMDDARTEAQNRTRALTAEAQQLRATIDSYDLPLMRETLALINKAVRAGALTVSEYYNQADRIHAAMLEQISLENKYNKLMCDLNR